VNTRMCMAAILSACVVLCVEGVSAQTNPSCKYFTVVSWDNLNNVTLGLSAEDVKWFQKTFSKKFPDICYAEPALTVPIVFFITVAPDVYHAAPAVNQICTQTNPGRTATLRQSAGQSTQQKVLLPSRLQVSTGFTRFLWDVAKVTGRLMWRTRFSKELSTTRYKESR